MAFPSQLSRAARSLDPLHVGSLRPDTRCQPSLQMRGATQKLKAHVFEHFGIQTNLRPSLRIRGRGMCSYQITCPCQSASPLSRCPTSCLGCASFGNNKCERQCTKLLSFTNSKCKSESSKPHAAHHHDYTPGDRGDEDPDSSTLEVVDKGYVIKVSKELMGLFCYIEKKKRTKIQELSRTLRQVAAVALALTCVRGILGPLLEVFKTQPPNFSKLVLMLVSFDSFAISYLAVKASEPLEQLANLTTENRSDIMEGVEKEEEMMLNLATEFIRLFKRMRNIAISITVSQTAQLIYAACKLKDPNFVANCSKIVGTWLLAPWS